MNKITKFYGPPGTGKTSRCLKEMEDCLLAGARPEYTGFISFTRKAADEARDRAMTKFGFEERRLRYFKTIHALVYKQLSIRRESVMQFNDYRNLGRMLGMEINGRSMNEDGSMYGMGIGDRIKFIEGLARATKRPLKDVWAGYNEDVNWFQLDLYERSLLAYKKLHGMIDFNDMLVQFVAAGEQVVPSLDVLFIDEAQDSGDSQWDALHCLIRKAKKVYVAGDDDQAIYNWSGANVNAFLHLPATEIVLEQSHVRPPRSVHKSAMAVSAQIANRKQKVWHPAPVEGSVTWQPNAEHVDMGVGSWLLLARNGYMLAGLEETCIREGWTFQSVGQSPLDHPALAAIVAWERARAGGEISKAQVEEILKFLPDSTIALKKLRKRSDESPLTLSDVRGLGLEAQMGTHPDPAPIWHQLLRKISPELREYFIKARQNKEQLLKAPRIKISTIHAAKGGEATNVLLLTDVSSRSFAQMQANPDDELRVLYVAMTRTIENLHLVAPRTSMYFQI